MLKEALQWIADRVAPTFRVYGDQLFADRDMNVMSFERPVTLKTNSLQSIVDYVAANLDADLRGSLNPKDWRFIVHIESPTKVFLQSEAASDGERWPILMAEAMIPRIIFDNYIEIESFIIALQTQFAPSDVRSQLIELSSKVVATAEMTLTDDGSSQSVEVRQGIARRGRTEVPNPVILAPYRTFAEIEQPESPFVVRLKVDKEAVRAALYGVDSAEWRIKAVSDIAAWLRTRLPENAVVIG